MKNIKSSQRIKCLSENKGDKKHNYEEKRKQSNRGWISNEIQRVQSVNKVGHINSKCVE